MITIDASVVVKWMVKEDKHDAALAVVSSAQVFVAPDFVVWECLRALQKKVDAGQISRAHFLLIAQVISSLFVELVPAAMLAAAAARLAADLRHPIYDCAYLACAIERKCQLLTDDGPFMAHARRAGYGAIVWRLGEPAPEAGQS
jgi:predicted nucleic acid-binding protein